MRLLLDTHIAIWAAAGEADLKPAERAAILGAEVVAVSAVSIWEARLKWQSYHASGDRKGIIAPDRLLSFADAAGWRVVALTARHAASSLTEPPTHKDPFDELLLVQAQEEGLRLLTRDRQLIDHPLAY